MGNDFVFTVAVVAAAVYAAFACICRINLLRSTTHRTDWIALYILQAAFAAGALLDTLLADHPPGMTLLSGLLAIALFLRLSRQSWASGAPAHLEKTMRHGASNSVPPGGTR